MIDHNVGRIEIPMNNFLLIMHVPQNRQKTNEEPPNNRLLKKLAFLTLVPNKLREVRPLYNFHHDVQIFVLNKGLVKFNYIGMFKLFVNFNLSELFVHLLMRHLRDLDPL